MMKYATGARLLQHLGARWRVICAIVALASSVGATAAFPAKPIKIVVPLGPGGITDLSGRYYATLLEKRFNSPVVVENRPGASGTVGAGVVVRSNPDGYTLLFLDGSVLTRIFNKNGAIDTLRELAPVSAIQRGAVFVFVSDKLPIRTFQELVAYSKANPGKLNYGSSGPQGGIAMAWLKSKTGLQYTDIRYPSMAGALVAMQAGDVHFSLNSPQLPIGSAPVRYLVAASNVRSSVLPDVPTAEEVGVPGFRADFIQGMWAPAGVEQSIMDQLSAAFVSILAGQDVRDYVRRTFGVAVIGSNATEHRRLFEASMEFWSEAARIADFHPQ